MDSDLEKLRRLIRGYMNLDEEFVINRETTVLSICEDSMGVLEFAFEVEDAFDINIANPEKIRTIGDLLEVIADAK